jgi:hypothetical protein
MINWFFGGGNSDEEENRHSAADEEACEQMGKKNGWELKRVEPNDNSILPVDCVFKGKQSSFQDDWHDDQD